VRGMPYGQMYSQMSRIRGVNPAVPQYDYRCKHCHQRFALFYKTYAVYDAASPKCPHCGGTELSRLITHVAIAKPNRDYSRMSSNEMLSVLETGDEHQVSEMFQQVGGGHPAMAAPAHQMSRESLKEENISRAETDKKQTPAKP